MRNKLIIFTTLVILVLVSSACGGGGGQPQPVPDPTPTPNPNPTKTPISLAITPTDGFTSGDKAGLYIVFNTNSVASTSNIDNMAVVYGKNVWTSSTITNWVDNTSRGDFYCYFPYYENITNKNEYRFTVNTDQKSDAAFKNSNFMWGKTESVLPTSSPVNIQLQSLMSTLTVKLIAGPGYSSTDIPRASVQICGVKKEATINLTTGAITAVGESDVIQPHGTGDLRTAIVVPQSIQDANLIVVTIDGKEFKLKHTINLETGKNNECSITLKRTSEGLDLSVSGWESTGVDHGGTV
ncbi:MAG: fimbrillin family protein [Muribaculaceae bacterium]|nr:fimbrillin family protein [Muribaculaceae bacterium]